jgi:hypothetical protein
VEKGVEGGSMVLIPLSSILVVVVVIVLLVIAVKFFMSGAG